MPTYYTEMRLNTVKRIGSIIPVKEYKRTWVDRECYLSVYLYNEEGLAHWQKYNTCEGYNGSMTMSTLYIDIDFAGNLAKAQTVAQNIVTELKTRFKLQNEQLYVFFSGGKGFHIGISSKIFNGYLYSDHNVPLIAKAMVADIIKVDPFDTKAQTESPIDFSIYNRTRIFRAPLSRHKSGMYKIPISVDTLFNKDVEHIKSMAANKQFDKVQYVYYNSVSLTKLFNQYKKIKPEWSKVTAPLSKVTNTQISGATTTVFEMPDAGGRNNALYRMAFRMFSAQQNSAPLKREEVWDIMEIITDAINSKLKGVQPITMKELNASLLSAERGSRMQSVRKFSVSSFANIIQQAGETIRNRRAVPTNIPEFDAVMKGGFRLGNFYMIIGKGGTKKSMFLQDKIILPAAINHDLPGMLFNLEMSEEQLVIRGIKMLLKKDFEDLIAQGNVDMDLLQRQVETKISSRIITVSDTAESKFTPELIEEIVKDYEKETGIKMYYIAIDSLGAMDMGFNEVSTLIKYSAQLKKVAKTLNAAVIAIHHVNKTGFSHYRDSGPYVRGGPKLTDNADGYLSLSLVVDEAKSNFPTQEFKYKDEYLWVKLVDKRESGANIDKMFTMSKNLSLVELDDDPLKYEVRVNINNRY